MANKKHSIQSIGEDVRSMKSDIHEMKPRLATLWDWMNTSKGAQSVTPKSSGDYIKQALTIIGVALGIILALVNYVIGRSS